MVATLILNLNLVEFSVSDDSSLRKHSHNRHAFFWSSEEDAEIFNIKIMENQ